MFGIDQLRKLIFMNIFLFLYRNIDWWHFWAFFCYLWTIFIKFAINVLLKLFSIELEPFNNSLNDYVRMYPTLIVKILRSDFKKFRSVQFFSSNWITWDVQLNSGLIVIEWIWNQRWTSWGDQLTTFRGKC